MKTTIEHAITTLGALADRRGWRDIAGLTSRMLDKSNEDKILIATAVNCDAGDFKRWLAEMNVMSELCSLVEVQTIGPALYEYGRIVTWFEAGRLFESSDLEILRSSIFTRPRNSYTVVVGGMQAIETPDDLALAQRNALRMLVAEPDPADGADPQYYFWATDPKNITVQREAQHGRRGLIGWLEELRDNELFDYQRANAIFDLAERHTTNANDGGAIMRNGEAARISRLREQVLDLRRRLLRRLDADTGAIGRRVTASLQTLEVTLRRGLRPYLTAKLPLTARLSERQLRHEIEEYLAPAYQAWQRDIYSVLKEQSDEINSEMDALFARIDWDLLNKTLAGTREGELYPASIRRSLRFDGVVLSPDVTGEADAGGPRSSVFRRAAGVTTATLLTAGSYLVLGIFPAVGVGVGLTTLMGAGYRREKLEKCIYFAERAIASAMIAASRDADNQVRLSFQPVRDALSKSLTELETALGGSSRKNGIEESEKVAENMSDRTQLTSLRAQMNFS